MTKLSGYSVSFGYGATDGVSYYTPTPQHPKTTDWIGYTHRGNDYPLVNEPVIVAGTVIGKSGSTGAAAGPHCHVQAGRDPGAQQTIDPSDYTDKPGTVYTTGTGSQWGKYVCVKVGDVYVYYCHLSEIKVSIGQEIGVDMKPNSGDVNNIIGELWGRPPNPEDYGYTNSNWHDFIYGVIDNYPYKDRMKNFAQAIEDAKKYKESADFSTWVANTRGERLNDVAKELGAKDGDDVDGIFNAIKALKEKPGSDSSALDKENNTILKNIWAKISGIFK